MSSTARIRSILTLLTALAFLAVSPAAAQDLTGQVEVDKSAGTATYDFHFAGPPTPFSFLFPYDLQINTLAFTPGAVMFEGQPVDFSGTEASWLATNYQGQLVFDNLPPQPLPPLRLGGLGDMFFNGPAGQGGGPQRNAQMDFGPNFTDTFFPLQPGQPFVQIVRFEDWNSPVVPQLNGATVSFLFVVEPTFVDPVNAIVQADIELSVFADPRPIIDNVEIKQINWLDENGGLLVPNSSWGVIEFDMVPHPYVPYFLNVFGDIGNGPAWLVQNFPIFPDPLPLLPIPDPLLPPQGLDLDLTKMLLPPATPLAGLELMLQTTQLPMPAPPPFFGTPVPVQPQFRFAHGSEHPGFLPQPIDVASPSGVEMVDFPECWIQHKQMPAVQEEDSGCLAGAFARSISWLDKTYDLGSGLTAQEIYDDLRALGVGPGDTTNYVDDVETKSEYLKSLQPGSLTKILDLDNAIGDVPGVKQETGIDLVTWLKREMKTEDVELHYGNHIVTLTGFWQTGQGTSQKTFVKYRDDEEQGDDTKGDAREKTAELRKNPDGSYSFREKGTKDFFKVKLAVSESVPVEIRLGKQAADIVVELLSDTSAFQSFEVAVGSIGDLGTATPFPCARHTFPTPIAGLIFFDSLTPPVSDPDLFFLVRPNGLSGPASVNSLGLGQVGDRDPLFDCSSCAHNPCVPGVPLDPFCDANLPGQSDAVGCVDAVCSIYPSCCDLVWDAFCVEQAAGGLCSICP